jgi:hypothetical protein
MAGQAGVIIEALLARCDFAAVSGSSTHPENGKRDQTENQD